MAIALLQLAPLHPPHEGEQPHRVRVIPAGEFRAVDGRGPWRIQDAGVVIAASQAAIPLPVDENHASDHAMRAGGAAPARGWITELTAEPDGIHATIEWTRTGRELLAERAYRSLSPVIEHDAAGNVRRLLRVALTNTPAVPALTLTQKDDGTMDLAQLRAALGLAADADDAAIVAAANAAQAARAALTRIATASGLAADTAPDAVVTTLTARIAAGDPAALLGQVAAMEARLAQLTQASARETAERAVDEAIRAGKPVKATREQWIAMLVADPTGAPALLAALPNINDGGIVKPPAESAGDGLGADEAKVATLLGIDPTKMAAEKKRQRLQEAR